MYHLTKLKILGDLRRARSRDMSAICLYFPGVTTTGVDDGVNNSSSSEQYQYVSDIIVKRLSGFLILYDGSVIYSYTPKFGVSNVILSQLP